MLKAIISKLVLFVYFSVLVVGVILLVRFLL